MTSAASASLPKITHYRRHRPHRPVSARKNIKHYSRVGLRPQNASIGRPIGRVVHAAAFGDSLVFVKIFILKIGMQKRTHELKEACSTNVTWPPVRVVERALEKVRDSKPFDFDNGGFANRELKTNTKFKEHRFSSLTRTCASATRTCSSLTRITSSLTQILSKRDLAMILKRRLTSIKHCSPPGPIPLSAEPVCRPGWP